MAKKLTATDRVFIDLQAQQGNVCKFTGKPFEDRGDFTPHADHCHKTAMFRGYVHAIVNRFLGAAETIMDYCDWTPEQLVEQTKAYLNAPGMDLGLERYPDHLGYDTEEEAIAAYERNLKKAA